MVYPASSSQQLPTSQVELSIACRNLKNLDIGTKSDPQCLIFLKDSFQTNFLEIARTEQIQDNLNPDFVKKVLLNYSFETVQKLRFEIWDIDPVGKDFVGQVETTLAEIVANKGRQFIRNLTGKVAGRVTGQIHIVVEELTSNKQVLNCQFKGCGLTRKRLFFSNDPFLTIWKSNEDNTFSVVHKTESVRMGKNPTWKSFAASVRSLCNGDFDRNIRLDVMDRRLDGDHKLIGSCFTTLNRLTKGSKEENKYQLNKSTTNSTSSNNNKNKRGHLEVVNFTLTEEPTFLDYVRGGTELHFAVAIDFTASNGPITDPASLHFLEQPLPHYQQKPNSYEVALRAVGEIIASYDTKGMFPGFGFGAKVLPNEEVSHQFSLNSNPAHPYCKGVEELIAYYKQSLKVVTLYGPTNFAPVINSTAAIARGHQDGQNYFILLIITDGIICDMYQTKVAMIEASTLPLSIIIVGVGNADFTAMDELDSDDRLLHVDGNRAARDIVQFVPMNKFVGKEGGWIHSQFELAREVLYEVPGQVVGYMKLKGFRPKPAADQSTVDSIGSTATAPPILSP